MPAQLHTETKRYSTGLRVELAGEIDASFTVPATDAGGGALVVDLSGVRRITSFGVREWIRFLQAVSAPRIYFTGARPALVAQFNMVAGFAGHGVVVSLYLPYLCPSCDTESEVLLDLRTRFDVVKTGAVPDAACPRCGEPSELDDLPETYFGFVATQPAPVVPAEDAAVVDGATLPAAAGRPLRVHKEVALGVTGLWLDGDVDEKARLKRALDGVEGTAVVICTGIGATTHDGAVKLGAALQMPGADVWIARARPAFLAALDDAKVSITHGRVVSVLLKSICGACTAHRDVEADPAAIQAAATDDAVGRCASCGAAVPLLLPSDDRGRLAAHLASEVPVPVQAYLDARPGDAPPEAAGKAAMIDSRGAGATTTRYEILRRIGTGGMAEVLLARQRGLQGFQKKVVVKRILPQLASNPDFVEMFLREARIAARINHPNVVQIYDLGQDGEHYFIAMEYVRGWDLRTALGAATRLDRMLPIGVAVRIAADVCAGLHAAHVCVDDDGAPLSIVHRDVSPHNVLLSLDGGVKIADFGISKARDGATGTTPGTLKGKIIYMAPEQVDGAIGPVDVLSDTFATGLLLHESLTGNAVFRRPSEAAAMHAVLHAVVPSVRALRPDVPVELDRIVAKATMRDRAARYASCAEMQKDLEDLARTEGLPATATHVSTWLTEIAEVATSLGAAPRLGLTPSGTRTGIQTPWVNDEPTGEDAPTVAAKGEALLEKAKSEE